MLRGYQRKLIMIRTKESSIFESAFFILRGASSTRTGEDDMIAEANRILDASGGTGRAPKSFKVRHILIALGIGFLAGTALLGGLWLWSALTPS